MPSPRPRTARLGPDNARRRPQSGGYTSPAPDLVAHHAVPLRRYAEILGGVPYLASLGTGGRLWLSLAALLRHYAVIFGGVVYIETLQYLDLLMDPVFGFPGGSMLSCC